MAGEFQVSGQNDKALFSLKLHRGEGMLLLGMNWKDGLPPFNFVGFTIDYKEPGKSEVYPVKNRIGFPDAQGNVRPETLTTLLSPIQKFRWVHFPKNPELSGEFSYRVRPAFMDDEGKLTYGEAQEASIELARETYPGQLNVTFTRGFVSSQAFVDRFSKAGRIDELIPRDIEKGLSFVPTHPQAKEALAWMGFEARHAILETLDQAIADQAHVSVVAYELNQPDILTRLEAIGSRLRVIIDDSDKHEPATSAESQAAERLKASAGANNVKRQHMGGLQHNNTIVVDGPTVKKVVCGSTNFSWRGFFIQSNNAIVLSGQSSVDRYSSAFNEYWQTDDVSVFGATPSATWGDLGLAGIDAKVAFSPHSASNALLASIAHDIENATESSLLYSLAFLYQTPGLVRDALSAVTTRDDTFVYGISDKDVGGIDLQKPDGDVRPVSPAMLAEHLPEPFHKEAAGGSGVRMHHKFVVIDFDKPTARVYLGSYNFSEAADTSNGENLLLIKDRRVTTSYAIEAISIFDHYHFRLAQKDAATAHKKLLLKKPPGPGEDPWFAEDYKNPVKIRDREIFS
ncbi:phospholipase [Rhizobium ruizarguesonis]|uniref:phospholipase D-like domain-containing protein n=1 Tax=Rhizobium ruizarguesonis TaxID=2081791 RepID=UPI00102FA40E|nr:phospholipase D-like domain-containing protein [Rhizobium ruizarguesonis]TBA20977.1 phospholipase [Rhizobium ruizarguesonis]